MKNTLPNQLIVKNGIPQSHKFIEALVTNKKIPGLLWNDKDVLNEKNQLLLYRGWPTVHFDSPWYEIEAEREINEQATQRDIQLLKTLLGTAFTPPKMFIDVHCGSGRHAIDLAKIGFQVMGMEEVAMPLELATKAAEKQTLNVQFVLSNEMNHERYRNTADIVISMFNSLGYTLSQKDDQRQFNWIGKLLKPNGYFVLDIRNHAFLKKQYTTSSREKTYLSLDGQKIATMYTTTLWYKNKLGALEEIFVNDKPAQKTTYGWNTYSKKILGNMLAKAGMELISVHEDYYTHPKKQGERIFLVSKKK